MGCCAARDVAVGGGWVVASRRIGASGARVVRERRLVGVEAGASSRFAERGKTFGGLSVDRVM